MNPDTPHHRRVKGSAADVVAKHRHEDNYRSLATQVNRACDRWFAERRMLTETPLGPLPDQKSGTEQDTGNAD
jgi:hypothetical protein